MVKVWDPFIERKRLENLKSANLTINSYKNKIVLTDYIPAHVWYNWGEYPAEKCPMPTEEDAKNFALYKEKGMELIKIHEEWNDALEIFGEDKFTPNNEEGFKKLIDLAHQNGLKFIPYISTGYYDRRSKNYNPKWASFFKGKILSLDGGYFNYGLCSPRSPEWRAFLLNNIEKLFDKYKIDGLYDDVGYDPLCFLDPPSKKQEHVDAFEESFSADGSFEDLIQQVYSIVKRYQGIFTLHSWKYANSIISYPPRIKCWDYLYLGEGISDMNTMRRTVRYLPPYVFYIPDWRVIPKEDPKKIYALSIPYLQFPVLYHGRSIKGKMYKGDKLSYKCGSLEVGHPEIIAKHYKKHPDDYPVYSSWDSVPGNPKVIEDYFHFLPIYKNMTKPGTHVFIDIQGQSLTDGRLWPDLVISAFVNDEFYLAVANFSKDKDTLVFKDKWIDLETGKKSKEWQINSFELKLLKKQENINGPSK